MNPQIHRSRSLVGARTLGAVLAVVALLATAAMAQSAGTVATLDGTVEIGRGGTWTAAAIGAPVEVGDNIRTGKPGRVRIALIDDSVINIGDDSQIVIDQQVYDPAGGEVRSVLELTRGKLRSIVSDRYSAPNAAFEVETRTAVSGVRGTDFIMLYDPELDSSQVVGVSGLVDVNGAIDLTRNGVVVGAQEMTEIPRGGYPTPPRRLDEKTFRQYLEGLEFIGFGLPESLALDYPLFDGAYVPPADRVDERTGGGTAGGGVPRGGGIGDPPWEKPPNVSDKVDQPPGSVGPGAGEVGIEF
jgi:hypothetical protein